MRKPFRDLMKKITPIRKTVIFIRKVTYPKYRKLYDLLSEELSSVKAENSELKEKILSTDKSILNVCDWVGAIESSQNKENLLIKTRMNALNSATNIILYKNELERFPADESFNPKVSIIMPVYNGEKYLSRALFCAFNQTYKNIEIIAVNDGSRDKTDEILRSYGEKITYIKKENGGVSCALNAGIKAMTGEYFAWLSHDDLIDSDHIEKLVEYLRHHTGEKVIPYSAFKFVDENGNLLTEGTINAKINIFDYKISVTDKYAPLLFGEINGGSVLIPKEAFEKYGMFDESMRITQERDMWSRLIKEYRFVCIPYDTASIRIHSQQVSSAKDKVAEESNKKNLEIIDEIYQVLKKENPNQAETLCSYLCNHYRCNGNDYMCEKIKEKCAFEEENK